MKIYRFILFFVSVSVLLAACASPVKTPTVNPTQPAALENNRPVLFWQRNGGIAGFCDTVTVLASGAFTVEHCGATPVVRNGQLDGAQLEQLTSWVNTFQSFTDGDDNTTATHPDQMFVKTVFTGTGSMQASPEQMMEISDFAATLTVSKPVDVAETPKAILKVREFLAARLSLPVDAINTVSVEAVEWSDSCMGLGQPDQMCAQVITPGYKVMLEAGAKSYELHSNESGEIVLLAP